MLFYIKLGLIDLFLFLELLQAYKCNAYGCCNVIHTGSSVSPTMALTHSNACGELARMLSTLPARNRRVEALSYVDTRRWCTLNEQQTHYIARIQHTITSTIVNPSYLYAVVSELIPRQYS